MLELIADKIEKVEQGVLNPLDIYIELKSIQKELTKGIKQIESEAITEAQKHGQKSFDYAERVVTISDGKRTWKYDQVPAIADRQKEIKHFQKLAQQVAKTGKEIVDAETGEVITAAREEFSKPFLTIK